MQEIWKGIKDYEGIYEISNTGKIRSLNYGMKGKIVELRPHLTKKGYLRAKLHKNKIRKQIFVHRLVVEAFIGEIPEGMVVNHKDECKTNNNVDNLEICTNLYNINYGTRNQRLSESHKGKIVSLECRAKISAANKGRICSPEHRAKISASKKAYHLRRKENVNGCK